MDENATTSIAPSSSSSSWSEVLVSACYSAAGATGGGGGGGGGDSGAATEDATGADVKADQKQKSSSLELLIFVSLLIMTILTIWMFKHIRVRFIHETGLAVIYGLIVGAIIKYSTYQPQAPNCTWKNYVVANWTSSVPDDLRIRMVDVNNLTLFYKYARQPHNEQNEEPKLPDIVEKATFNSEVFFNVILPPIIFCAGYSMKRKHFFRNFGAISAYAFLGTIISSVSIGVLMLGFTRALSPPWGFHDCLLFGAIISATDPVTVLAIFHDLNVDVDLYALVFGESVLNDAVAIILVRTLHNYGSQLTGFDGKVIGWAVGAFAGVFFGSFCIGVGMGCITALMTKFTHIRDYPILETSLFVTMSYCTFLAAEALDMTGIVAVLFCGISQAHYTYNNLSTESKARTKQVFELLNFLMENFVFAYIGISTFTFSKHNWNLLFIFFAFLAIIIARAFNIYPLSALLNLGRSNKIRFNFQHLMMFSGLRGAMAFALAIDEVGERAETRMIFSTTLVIVTSTVILCGGLTTPVLQWLKIRVGVEEERELQSFESLRTSPSEPRIPHSELNPGRLAEKALFVRMWYNFDANYVKPLLTHAQPPLTETLPGCCLPLARLLTTEQQMTQPTLVGTEQPDDSDADLVADDHELNYGERSEHNHRFQETNSVFNDNHVMISPASGQEVVIAETHLQPASLRLPKKGAYRLLNTEDDHHPNPRLASLEISDDNEESDVGDDVRLLPP